jgi:D-alanyl-D-alanine carboxypeptidase
MTHAPQARPGRHPRSLSQAAPAVLTGLLAAALGLAPAPALASTASPSTALASTALARDALGSLAPASTAQRPAAPAAPAAAPAARDPLPAMLAKIVAAGVPGAILLEQRGPDADFATAGVANLAGRTSLRPDARFRIGSITKSFVAAVVLQLVQEGRLALGQPVGHWLPGLLADGGTITVRELLNHTSGLYDYTDDPAFTAAEEANQVFRPAQLVAIAESHPLVFPPGSAYGYSNTNYIVAGLLIQAVTHRSLGWELGHRIFGPLGLRHTSFPVTAARIAGYHADGYAILAPGGRPADVTALNPSGAWAAGAIVSTASDVARFYQALLGGRLLSPRTMTQLETAVDETPGDPAAQSGLGIERYQDPCGVTWGHGGQIPGYQDAAFWNQRTHRVVVLATTLWPGATPAAEKRISNAYNYALCSSAS